MNQDVHLIMWNKILKTEMFNIRCKLPTSNNDRDPIRLKCLKVLILKQIKTL